jgi:hypothetical protein
MGAGQNRRNGEIGEGESSGYQGSAWGLAFGGGFGAIGGGKP